MIYGIATGNDHMELAGIVNDQILQGYIPHGSVFTTTQHNQFFIHQPMILADNNFKKMDFFKQLAGLGEVDLTMRIMKVQESFTINIMPGSGSSKTKPLIINGHPEALDEEFFSNIMPGVKEAHGIVTNLDDFKKDPHLEKKEVEEDDGSDNPAPSKGKSKSKPEPKKKPEKVKAEKSKPAQPEQQLFPE